MNKTIQELIERCEHGWNIEINRHKLHVGGIACMIDNINRHTIEPAIPLNVARTMIEKDTLIKVSVYAKVHAGQVTVYHYDYDMALDLLLEAVRKRDAS